MLIRINAEYETTCSWEGWMGRGKVDAAVDVLKNGTGKMNGEGSTDRWVEMHNRPSQPSSELH